MKRGPYPLSGFGPTSGPGWVTVHEWQEEVDATLRAGGFYFVTYRPGVADRVHDVRCPFIRRSMDLLGRKAHRESFEVDQYGRPRRETDYDFGVMRFTLEDLSEFDERHRSEWVRCRSCSPKVPEWTPLGTKDVRVKGGAMNTAEPLVVRVAGGVAINGQAAALLLQVLEVSGVAERWEHEGSKTEVRLLGRLRAAVQELDEAPPEHYAIHQGSVGLFALISTDGPELALPTHPSSLGPSAEPAAEAEQA